jgi:hypothetical protein
MINTDVHQGDIYSLTGDIAEAAAVWYIVTNVQYYWYKNRVYI